MQLAPPRVEMDDIIRWGNMKIHFLQQGRHPQSNDPTKMYGIKCVPSFFELEYWKVCIPTLLPHDTWCKLHIYVHTFHVISPPPT